MSANLYSQAASPLSPRRFFGSPSLLDQLSPASGGYAGTGTTASKADAYKFPGTILSYVGGTERAGRNIFKSAPGAPRPIEELGPYGEWKGNRFGYILAISNAGSVRAIQAAGYPLPSPEFARAAVERYYASLSQQELQNIQGQLGALAEEQGYDPTLAGNSPGGSYRSPRSVSSGARALSPVEILDQGIDQGITGSYAQQYGQQNGGSYRSPRQNGSFRSPVRRNGNIAGYQSYSNIL